MQIKPPELLNRLPSVSELLEKPPIRALAERWNRSVVAGRVQSFLDELRTDFDRRTAALPSIRELAERAARYVVSRQHDNLGIAINATGSICGEPWTAIPLSEDALARMMALGREFGFEPNADNSQARKKIEALLCRLTGAQAAAVVHSYSAAIWLARERGLVSIVEMGSAPLTDPPESIGRSWNSARAIIASGAELVILRGDGLVGGPDCGILLGNQSALERAAGHPLFESLRLDPLRIAGLTATIEPYEDPKRAGDTLPVWQLLSISVENLRNRAERLATQLAHVDGISAAVAVESKSTVSDATGDDDLPSYGVALTPADGNAAALGNRLRTARFPIIGRIDEGKIVLDLRTVFPRQDKQIVDSLLGDPPASAAS